MGVLNLPGRLYALMKNAEELFALHNKVKSAIEIIDERLTALELRIRDFEAEQRQTVVEARAAAGAASTVVTTAVISDVITRLTRIEMRVEDASKRLE